MLFKVAITKIGAYEFYISPPNEGSNFSHAVVSRRMGKLHNMCDGQKHGISETTEDPYDRESRDGTCSRAETSVPRQNDPLEKNFVQAHPSYLKTLGQAHSGWIFGAIAELVDNSRDAKATKFEVSIGMVYSKIAGKGIPMLSVIDDGHGMTHQQILRMISFGHEQPDADDPDHIGRFGIGFKTGAMRLGKDALVLTQTANSRSIAFLSQSLNEGKDNLEIPIVSYCRRGQFMEVDTSVQTEALAKHNLKAIKEFSPFNKYLIGEKASLFQEKRTGTQIYIWNLDKWGSDYCLEWQTGRSGGSSFHQGDILIRSQRIRSRPGQTSRRVPLDYSLRAYLEVIFLDPRMKLYVQGSLVRSLPLAKCLNRTVVENGNIMGKHVQIILGRCQLEWEQANCGIFLYWHGRLIEAYKRVGGMIHSADTGRGVIGVLDVTDLMKQSSRSIMKINTGKDGGRMKHSGDLKRQDDESSTPTMEINTNKDGGRMKPLPAIEIKTDEDGLCSKDYEVFVVCSGEDEEFLNDGNGQVWVHSNKQGFQDCELYARLEEWLGSRFDQYWDNNYDALQLEKGGAFYKPDHEWVQCDKCRKWRMLRSGFDSRKLPQEWFCYMDPFNGKCEMSEQKVERGVIIVSEKRAGYDSKRKHVVDEDALHVKPNRILQGSSDNDDDDSEQTVEDGGPHCLKRLRRGPARFCKKT
ncbi:hypothetical protein TEA_023593 [Camellia sinensis var. sinensis]|uniref:CW-type domain-containing protein n=1 Tax=Camellia sinensis var. sinensis TaxID=542762 RepID=A0A4S4EYJ9_CAMSN|nr:hypothetical protein TEA_023593 [Camellia sinensis var. sinensis]